MDTEQTQADSVESRLGAFFATPEAAEAEEQPIEAPQEQPEPAETTATEQPEEDSEDFEVDDVVYKLPKELKAKVSEWRDAGLRQEDYTRKTQTAAELMRQAQALQEAAAHREQFETSIKTERRQLDQIESHLEQYAKVDWRQLDSEQRLNFLAEQQMLERQANTLRQGLEQKRQSFDKESNEKRQRLYEAGQKYLQQAIPNWGDAAAMEIIKAVTSAGFTKEELASVHDARQIHLAWKAAQWDKLQASKGTAVKTAQKAPPVVKPGATVNNTQQRDRDQRSRLKKTGDVKDAYSLLAKHLKV